MTQAKAPAPASTSAVPEVSRGLRYPEAPRGEQQDSYHGVVVADPYRWLEAID